MANLFRQLQALVCCADESAVTADDGEVEAVGWFAKNHSEGHEGTALLSQEYSPPEASALAVDMQTPLSIVVFGATGDLAKKKLFPALYQLLYGCPDAPLLPRHSHVIGFGRQPQIDVEQFFAKQCANVTGKQKADFLGRCRYFGGGYTAEVMQGLHDFLCSLEGGGKANRIFFFSIPPDFFAAAVQAVKQSACAPGGGYTRLIIEKPFGRDSATFAELDKTTSVFPEEQLFRIDHYLGKEVVLNMMTLRFGNQFFEPLWCREHIAHVQIIFKEDLGTSGRGAYFDKFGIIRDIMQNHLLQVLLWLAMEPPTALDRKHVAQAKCNLLRAIDPLSMKDCFLGQFGPNQFKVKDTTVKVEGYLDDPGVPKDSLCPTYAAVVLHINNARWKGVPFLMRAGKGLDERCAEVRVVFKKAVFNALVPGTANELVMRIQPDEAIYLKAMTKVPGWDQSRAAVSVLNMTYSSSFPGCYVADAYERMFLNTAKGDGSLFVGSDELREAWRIFTPLLQEIETTKVRPSIYPFGVSAPEGMTDFVHKYGIKWVDTWEEHIALHQYGNSVCDLFNSLDKDKDGFLVADEIKDFAKVLYGRAPSDLQVARIIDRFDTSGDGRLSMFEMRQGCKLLANCCTEKCKVDMSQWDE